MAYTSDSASDRLAAVRTAIDRVLATQAYTERSRRNQLADLRALSELEQRLMQEVGDAENSGKMATAGRYTRVT